MGMFTRKKKRSTEVDKDEGMHKTRKVVIESFEIEVPTIYVGDKYEASIKQKGPIKIVLFRHYIIPYFLLAVENGRKPQKESESKIIQFMNYNETTIFHTIQLPEPLLTKVWDALKRGLKQQ